MIASARRTTVRRADCYVKNVTNIKVLTPLRCKKEARYFVSYQIGLHIVPYSS